MTMIEEMSRFIVSSSYNDISEPARSRLKIHILDALACAAGALEGVPVQSVRRYIDRMGSEGPCTLIGGGRTSPERAALYNSFLVRYLDFNDSYLAKGETCHPSDNLGAVLAASEYADIRGTDLIAALACAYQVQCRLSDTAPVRARGFDHTTQGSYAAAAGVSKALGLDRDQTANALAICGTAFNALRVTRTGRLSIWKGLAYPNTAFCCTHACFLAREGITGPLEVLEGKKGFMEAISGDFRIDWSQEDLEKVMECIIKKYNAEIHSQSAIEGLMEIREEYPINHDDIDSVEIEIFDVAYHIIGGGDEGSKKTVQSKEEADHSLPYMAAAAILDGELTPAQYSQDRIMSEDIQALLQKISIIPSEEFSRRFPTEMPCRITIKLHGGRVLQKEKRDYEGFRDRPFSWERAVEKFNIDSEGFTDSSLRGEIIDSVRGLEIIRVRELTGLLSRINIPHS